MARPTPARRPEARRTRPASSVLPRDPVRRARWLARLIGPALALPLAGMVAAWLAVQAQPICTAASDGCAGLVALGACGPLLVVGLLAVGLVLGLLLARARRPPRLVLWATRVIAAGLPFLPVVLVGGVTDAASLRHLILASVLGTLAAGLVTLPSDLTERLLVALNLDRRRWWYASLRAARLTRRTLGAGVYRQLCLTGFIRVPSAVYPARVYFVPRRTSPSGARVLVEERGRVIGGLCLRPREPLPDPEEVVAHVLLLRGDERAYLAAANFFPYDTVLTPQATARRL